MELMGDLVKALVVPTRVGVNRTAADHHAQACGGPHACGGEPVNVAKLSTPAYF